MRKIICFLFGLLGVASAQAAMTIKSDANVELELSIYNNTALVKDCRNVNLPGGRSSVLFAGVSGQIKPESVIVNAQGVMINEQNYNFAGLSPENVAKENIGKIVKTVIWDEDKGKNIYDKARVLNVYAGRPILQFGYGIEFDFPGRLIWDNLPDNLQAEPSLDLSVTVQESGEKRLDLIYLTGGLRWNTNYVAEFISENELNLKSWVSISNTSGISYKQARVQLVAGEANLTYATQGARPMLMMNKAVRATGNDMASEASLPQEEGVGEYYVYTLPDKITIADNQTKQVSLLRKDKIKYHKEYRLNSPLLLRFDSQSTDFKKINSDVYIKLINNEDSHLGNPLPRGIMRFYDHDSKGNILFMGEAAFKQLAVGEETDLRIGRSFDVTASGKITNLRKIADNTAEAEVSVTFMNAKTVPVNVVFEQYMHHNWSILSQNIQGEKSNAQTMRWIVEIPAQGSTILNFKVRLVKINA